MVSGDDQREASAAIARYRAWALEPAGIAPPGVDPGPSTVEGGGLVGRAELVRAELAPWNQWGSEARPLLFNDRVALLFEVRIEGEGGLRWVPERTALEVNSPEQRVVAVPSPEHLLADLQWHALQQEKWLLDGDLVDRTRYAGRFREAWFHRVPGGYEGVIPFALEDPEQHIGALRLTVALAADGATRELVWVFQ